MNIIFSNCNITSYSLTRPSLACNCSRRVFALPSLSHSLPIRCNRRLYRNWIYHMLCVCTCSGVCERRPYAIFPAFIYIAWLEAPRRTHVSRYVRTYDEWLGAHAL